MFVNRLKLPLIPSLNKEGKSPKFETSPLFIQREGQGELCQVQGSFLLFLFRFMQFHENWQKRNDDNNTDKYVKMFFDVRDRASQKIADGGHAEDPGASAANTVSQKTPVLHPSHAGDRRSECPHDRHKTRKDQRLPAVFFKKFMRTFEMFFMKKQGIFALKEPRACVVSDKISGVVPCDRRRDQ